jgi:hypothetical protein
MIRELDVHRHGEAILLGIAVENAVLDVVTSVALLRECLDLLESPHSGLVSSRLGYFGDYPVTLNIHHDEAVSIFIDGPQFHPPRSQGAGVYLSKQDAGHAIKAALAEPPAPN